MIKIENLDRVIKKLNYKPTSDQVEAWREDIINSFYSQGWDGENYYEIGGAWTNTGNPILIGTFTEKFGENIKITILN